MGLLGSGWDDPQSQGLLALASGMISGNFGKGVADMNSTMAGAQDAALKRKLIQAQIGNLDSEVLNRQAAIDKQAQLQKLIQDAFGPKKPEFSTSPVPQGVAGSGTMDPANPQFQSPALGTTSPNTPQGAQMPQSGGLGLTPQQLALFKLSGMDLADIAKLGIPSQLGNGWVQTVDGRREYMADPTKGVTVNGKGAVSAMPGAAEALATIAGAQTNAQEAAKAGYDLVDVPRSDGTTVKMPRDQAIAALRAQTQGSPFANKGAPISQGVQSLIEADAKANGISNPFGNFAAPAGGMVALTSEAGGPRLGVTRSPEATKQATDDVIPTLDRQGRIDSAVSAYNLIDKALTHKGLEQGVGLRGTLDPRNYIPGTNAKDFGVLADQIKGTAFLSAYQQLRGAGAISEYEGQQAQSAIARLNKAQSPEEYKAALIDYQAVIARGLKNLGYNPEKATDDKPHKPIPAAAAAELRLRSKDPAMRAHFDAVFGAGAADRVLGGK